MNMRQLTQAEVEDVLPPAVLRQLSNAQPTHYKFWRWVNGKCIALYRDLRTGEAFERRPTGVWMMPE